MYLGKKTMHALYLMDAVSVILLITVFVGPELLTPSSVVEFLEKCKGLMVYHCIISVVATILFQWFHAEISTEFKSIHSRLLELEKKK